MKKDDDNDDDDDDDDGQVVRSGDIGKLPAEVDFEPRTNPLMCTRTLIANIYSVAYLYTYWITHNVHSSTSQITYLHSCSHSLVLSFI